MDASTTPIHEPDLEHIPPELRHLAVPIDSVILDPNNVNKHPAKQLVRLQAMLRKFGQRQLLVARKSTGILEAGEGRVLAGKAIGWTHIAVLYMDDDAVTALQYSLGDNQIARMAELDEARLHPQLLLLHNEGQSVDDLGWDDSYMAKLHAAAEKEKKVEEVDVAIAEPDAPTCIKLGDIVSIGPHRLLCGDSTKPEQVARLMRGEQADIVFTDPPYGVNYKARAAELEDVRLENDELADEDLIRFVHDAVKAWPLRAGGVWYVCSSPRFDIEFRTAIKRATGDRERSTIIWNKQVFGAGFMDYRWKHEVILYGWLKGPTKYWCGTRSECSVWDVDRPTKATEHPTKKPVEIPARAMRNSSRRGDIVFDGFGGSGSTMIAAHQLGRVARLIELSPTFCDVIARAGTALRLPVVIHRPEVGDIPWTDVLKTAA